jgi:hypothetical protein
LNRESIHDPGFYHILSLPRDSIRGSRHETIAQFAELITRERLGEHVGELLLGRDVLDSNGALNDVGAEVVQPY